MPARHVAPSLPNSTQCALGPSADQLQVQSGETKCHNELYCVKACVLSFKQHVSVAEVAPFNDVCHVEVEEVVLYGAV